MRVPEPVGELLEQLQAARERQSRAVANQLRERFTRQELHRDERIAVMLADVEDRHDVGMAQAAGGARLPREALAKSLGVETMAQQLDRDEAIDRGVPRKKQRAHPAFTDLVEDLIAAYEARGHRRCQLGAGSAPARRPRAAADSMRTDAS